MTEETAETLLAMLHDLDGVQQSKRYHPEGDALYHSMQVFGLAHDFDDDVEMWTAALLHDVGKAEAGFDHDILGAEMLEGLVSRRVVWLVRHHLDLLRAPRRTRRRLRGQRRLVDLDRLRRFDLRGRSPHAWVFEPEAAIELILRASVTSCSLSDSIAHALECS